MKIIDFERKGNVVRFWLGEKSEEWGWVNPEFKDYDGKRPDWLKPLETYYGDDWDDRPYEHNAGRVYDEFIRGHKDISFDYEDVVLEPCDGELNSSWSKEDMAARRVPCVVVIKKKLLDKIGLQPWQVEDSFNYALGIDGVEKYYFGDELMED